MIKAHEIQGCLALENSFNKVGLDHVVLVKVATTAVVAHMLGLTHTQILGALSLAWVDGQSLRTYRSCPEYGFAQELGGRRCHQPRCSFGIDGAGRRDGLSFRLSAPVWGFYDVLFHGKQFSFQRPYGCYVMENVLFKISFPAEFHAQTAVEAAMTLRGRLVAAGKSARDIVSIELRTHQACLRIIDKSGPLNNPADRDHCVQYMVAVPLLFGYLTASDYEDAFAADPDIDALRAKMQCSEEPAFTADYHDRKSAPSPTRSLCGSMTTPR